MTLNYDLIAIIDEVGLLATPFRIVPVESLLYDRIWMDRGFALNRYTGEQVFVTEAIGFGNGSFGSGYFGWS